MTQRSTTNGMGEWTDEFITHAQQELIALVEDWKYDYGADDRICSTMLLWMILKINPNAELNTSFLDKNDQSESSR